MQLSPRQSVDVPSCLTSHRDRQWHHLKDLLRTGNRDLPLQLLRLDQGGCLVSAAEPVVSVGSDPAFRDPWIYRLTDGVFDDEAKVTQFNGLEHEEADRGESDWRTKTESPVATDSVGGRRAFLVE